MTTFFHTESTVADGNLAIQHGEPDDVLKQTRTFLDSQGLSLSDCLLIACEHADKVTHVGEEQKAMTFATEALITNTPGVVLLLLTGDCFPVSYHDPVAGVVALAHLGWKPVDRQLAAKVVREMVEVYGSNPSDIKVYIGSGIGPDSYVFETAVQKEKSEWRPFITDLPSGEISIDLAAYIREQLTGRGVQVKNITISSIDTATSLDRFSHYRSVRTGEPEARFLTAVVLQE